MSTTVIKTEESIQKPLGPKIISGNMLTSETAESIVNKQPHELAGTYTTANLGGVPLLWVAHPNWSKSGIFKRVNGYIQMGNPVDWGAYYLQDSLGTQKAIEFKLDTIDSDFPELFLDINRDIASSIAYRIKIIGNYFNVVYRNSVGAYTTILSTPFEVGQNYLVGVDSEKVFVLKNKKVVTSEPHNIPEFTGYSGISRGSFPEGSNFNFKLSKFAVYLLN